MFRLARFGWRHLESPARIDWPTGRRWAGLKGAGVSAYPDGVPEQLDVAINAGTSDEYRNSWCVVFRPPEEPGAALVAYQTEPNRWREFWTYDAETVDRVDCHLDQSF